MSVAQDAFARTAFSEWLSETPPAICEEGNLIVWKGTAWGEPNLYEDYRVAIVRYADYTDIEVDCGNESMRNWMTKNKSYIKGRLIWYCRAVWQLMEEGLLDRSDFDRSEETAFAGEEERELSEEEEEWRAKEDRYDPFPYY